VALFHVDLINNTTWGRYGIDSNQVVEYSSSGDVRVINITIIIGEVHFLPSVFGQPVRAAA